jgi:hypothetical protein
MTREEIEAAALEYMSKCYLTDTAVVESDFIAGAEWALRQMQSQAAGDEPVSKELRVTGQT